MTNEGQRTTIEPEDWPLEETSRQENATGLKQGIGVSGDRPRADEFDPAGAGLDAGRGDLGTTTAGESGVEEA
jgi:hypothetical protein